MFGFKRDYNEFNEKQLAMAKISETNRYHEDNNKQIPLKKQLNDLVIRVDGEKNEWVFRGEIWEVIEKAFKQKDEEWKKKKNTETMFLK